MVELPKPTAAATPPAPKLNLTIEDCMRILEALTLKMTEWSQAPIPIEAKRPYLIAYQETAAKVQGFVEAAAPKEE